MRKNVRPDIAMLEVARKLHSSYTDDGLKDLFEAAASPLVTKEFGRGVRTRTKQLRRSLSYEKSAIKAAEAGDASSARAKLDQATTILDKTKGPFGFDYNQGGWPSGLSGCVGSHPEGCSGTSSAD